jgi:N-acyl-D-aspartate/D-glutamate deacylase
MKYDLVIRDGEVIDPGSSLRGHMDIAISGGKIVTGKRRLIPHLTPKDGRVVYERPAE